MCELLGMSANVPTDICFSFNGLIQRGGYTGPCKDGWGITFYQGKGIQTFKDIAPSYQSKIAKLVGESSIKSESVIAHIREANSGGVTMANTHPFTRELWGTNWTFAHNGQLDGVKEFETEHFFPIGDTDSEHAFCWLLSQLKEKYSESPYPSGIKAVTKSLFDCCEQLRKLGVFNMLLSDGRYMMAYCSNNLHWITRQAPFEHASLLDKEVSVDFTQETSPKDVVTIVATQPLTSNENWNKMKVGESILIHLGEIEYI